MRTLTPRTDGRIFDGWNVAIWRLQSNGANYLFVVYFVDLPHHQPKYKHHTGQHSQIISSTHTKHSTASPSLTYTTHTYTSNGPHKANCSQVDWWQSPSQTARLQGCQKIRTHIRRCQEAPSLSPRYSRAPRDPSLPKIHRALDPQTPLPTSRQGNCSRLQDRSPIPILCHRCSPGSR